MKVGARRDVPDCDDAARLFTGFGRDIGWTYLSFLVTGVSNFALAAWSVRRIGADQYGVFALVTSITAMMSVFDYALGLPVQRAAARVVYRTAEPGREERTVLREVHGALALR